MGRGKGTTNLSGGREGGRGRGKKGDYDMGKGEEREEGGKNFVEANNPPFFGKAIERRT